MVSTGVLQARRHSRQHVADMIHILRNLAPCLAGPILNMATPPLESQRPELLPLDVQAELHLRSDRTAIADRGWLRDLGLSFGTA
jgi:hypothetical protein